MQIDANCIAKMNGTQQLTPFQEIISSLRCDMVTRSSERAERAERASRRKLISVKNYLNFVHKLVFRR